MILADSKIQEIRRQVFFVVSGLLEHVECNTVRFASSYHFSALFPVTLQRFLALLASKRRAPSISMEASRGGDGKILIAAGPIYRLLAFPRKEALARLRGEYLKQNAAASMIATRVLFIIFTPE